MFGQLPPEEDRHALLEALAELIEQRGPEPLLRWPILLPTPEHFPDEWAPDLEGVRAMLLRLMAYAGLGELDARVEAFVEKERGPELLEGIAGEYRHSWHGTAAWFQGIHARTCLFGVELSQLGDPEQLVGVLAHEVAHAYRTHHGLVTDDPEHEEQLTDLTTVFLGFGLLTTNAADRSRSSGELNGAMVTHRWQRQQAGYLSPAAMSFLLATQVLARGDVGAERRRLKGALETNQAASFGSALSWLKRRAEHVLRVLHLPRDPGAATPSRPLSLPRLQRAAELSATQEEESESAPAPPVFRHRVRGFSLAGRMMFAALVGMVVSIPLGTLWPMVLLPALWAAAERWMFRPLCSGCEARLHRAATHCEGCGGVIAGDIARLRDRHDAEERYWAERGGDPNCVPDESEENPADVAQSG